MGMSVSISDRSSRMRVVRNAALCAVAGTLAALPATAATTAGAPVGAHNVSGVWWSKAPTMRLLPSDGKALPFTAPGRERYNKTVAGLKDGSIVDPAVRLCLPEGLPRALTSGYPFQIVATDAQLTFIHEANPFFRTVRFADKHADAEEWDPAYMGEGIASWKNRTLTIDSTNFNAARIYLDATGLPASEKLHVVEKIELVNRGSQLRDTVTIDDPVNFTRPWTARLTFERRPDLILKTDTSCGQARRDLSAARTAPGPSANPAPVPATLTPGQAAMNGFWKGPSYAPPPGAAAPRTGGAVPGTGPMAGMVPLMQPWAAAEFAKKVALEKAGQFVPTPTNTCNPAVVPGIGVPLGTQIQVEPNFVTFLYELNRTARIVRINQQHPPAPTPSWMGSSVGHWDGDTLTIETIGFNDQNVVANGVPISSKMRIVQVLKMVDGKLQEQTTFDDPGAMTKPFVKTVGYVPGERYQEYVCAENNAQGGVSMADGSVTTNTLNKGMPTEVKQP